MLVNQNQAAVIAETTRQNIHRISKLIPRPAYFIEIKGEAPMVDDEHPEFKYFCQRRKKRILKIDNNDNSADMEGLLELINKVITEEFGEKKALEIKFKIMDGM